MISFENCAASRTKLLYVVLSLGLLIALTTARSATTHRVALADLWTEENNWESINAAAEATTLLAAELSSEPDVEWVEREQLGLARKELELNAALGRPGLRDTIQRARWNKADWLITGRLMTSGDARDLVLDVIDLAHADVLANCRMKLPISAKESLKAILAHVHLIGDSFRQALRDAARREQEVAGLPTIAVLFYPDLEIFQQEFIAALSDPQITGSSGFRILRFPQVSDAMGEAELVLGGFAEDPEQTWRTIADVYVWGSLARVESGSIDGETITDARTPEITVTMWDRKLSPIRFVEESEPVERLEFDKAVSVQARRLAASVVEIARRKTPVSVDDSQRKQISRSVYHAAEQLQEGARHEEGYLHDPRGRRHFFNLVQTLEAACFFDPQNREAQETLLRIRWRRTLENEVRDRFHFQLGRSVAWRHFVDRFGIPEDNPNDPAQINGLTQRVAPERFSAIIRRQAVRYGENSVAAEFLNSACEAADSAALGNREDFGFPQGVPESSAAQWLNDLTLEIANRTLALAGRNTADLYGGLVKVFESRGPEFFRLRDARKRIEVLEKVWPQLLPAFKARAARGQDGISNDLRQHIQWTFAEVGKPGEEAKLFSMVPTPSAPPSPAPVQNPGMQARPFFGPGGMRPGDNGSQLFQLPTIAVLPPEAKPPIEKFEAPVKAHLYRVHQVVPLAGRIWLIAEGQESTEVQTTNAKLASELRPTSYEATRLWSFNPSTGTLERVEATRQFKPVSIFAHEGQLWLALGKDGVAVLNPNTGALRRFGPAEGLKVESAYRFATAGGRIFVTTDMMTMFALDFSTNRWSAWNAELPNHNGGYGGDIRQICGFDSWLLLFKGAVAICDVCSQSWKRYDEELMSEIPGRAEATGRPETGGRYPFVNCISADGTGFWLGSYLGLHFLNPQTGEVRNSVRRILTASNAEPFRRSVPPSSQFTMVDELLQVRTAFGARHASQPDNRNPLYPTSRIVGQVLALADDGDFLWVATTQANSNLYSWTYLMLFHKPTARWVAQIQTDRIASLTVDDKYVWLGCSLSYGSGAKCLQRLEKRTLYDIPQEQWVTDTVSEAEVNAQLERLGKRDQALWYFVGGNYAKAAELLRGLDPPTPETLFVQGLCYDAKGLNQPEKSHAFFQQIIDTNPRSALAEKAAQRLSLTQRGNQ